MSVITGASPAAAPGGAVRAVELAIGGMTCASCAARVEKKLSKLDGVSATVNFATETARVSFPAELSATDLVSVVEQAGYTAALPAPPRGGEPAGSGRGGRRRRDGSVCGSGCWCRSALAIPVVALAMIPALQFRNWQWASPGAGFPGGRVGGVAVPPRRRRQCPARRRDHGHAGVGRGRPRRTCGRCTRCSSAPRAGAGMHMSVCLAGARQRDAEPSTWTSPPG